MHINSILTRVLLGNNKSPGWAVVVVENPEDHVRVTLEGHGGSLDITNNHAVLELLPLMVGIGLRLEDVERMGSARLCMMFREVPKTEKYGTSDQVIGRVDLLFDRVISLPECELCLFHLAGGRDYSLPRARMEVNYLFHRGRLFFDRNPRNQKMITRELFWLWVLYMRLRPVYLMSYGSEAESNLFPVDLIGFAGPYFLISLRNSDPALSLIHKSRRMALSSAPASYKKLLSRLGSNHGKSTFDWSSIPIASKCSPWFGIPIPADTLNLMELKLIEQHDLGGHTVLVTSLEHRTEFEAAPQMCFTSRFFQQYLLRQGRPLAVLDEN